MSTETTPPPVAAKPAAATTEKKSAIPKAMMDRLAMGAPDPAPAFDNTATTTAPKKADATPAAAVPPVEPAKEVTPPVTPPARVKKKQAEPPPIPVAAPAVPSVADIVKQTVAEMAPVQQQATTQLKLDSEEERDLELARFAAERAPDKYRDLPNRIVSFKTERDQFLQAKAEEMGGGKSPEFREYVQSDEYKQWLRDHQPSYQRGDRQRLYEELLMEKGAKRTLEQIKPELDEVRRQTLEVQQAPIIQQTVTQAVNIMIADDGPDKDESLAEFTKDPQKFVSENEVEAGIILRNAAALKERANELLRITNGLVQLTDASKLTETQQWIDGYVVRKENELQTKYPNGVILKDGDKILVSREQLLRIPAAQRANYRTMRGEEIVGAMAADHRAETKNQLKAERERLARSGYQRVKKVETPSQVAQTTLPATHSSPMATSSAAPGLAGKAAKPVNGILGRFPNLQ